LLVLYCKGEVVPVHTMKAYGGSENAGQSDQLHDLATLSLGKCPSRLAGS